MVDTAKYMDWFDKGDQDLRSAKILMDHEGDFGIVCFHCQQAIEKHLKGYLIYKTGFLHQGHSLVKLCKKAGEEDKEFLQYLKDCAYVNDFYIETRYPAEDPIKVELNEVEESIRIAEEMMNFIKSIIKK